MKNKNNSQKTIDILKSDSVNVQDIKGGFGTPRLPSSAPAVLVQAEAPTPYGAILPIGNPDLALPSPYLATDGVIISDLGSDSGLLTD